VLVGEPGNGKTFFVENLCAQYRQFLSRPENRKYTFKFVGLDKLGSYGQIREIESQTYEDPMVLAMNLFESRDETMEFLAKHAKLTDSELETYYENYRQHDRWRHQCHARLYRNPAGAAGGEPGDRDR
jgi:serine protein kinase